MKQRNVILIEVAVVLLVIVGGIGLYYAMDHKGNVEEKSYSFSYIGLKPAGILADDEGNEELRFVNWTGSNSDLLTAWNNQGKVVEADTMSAQWLQYIIKINASAGTTVKLDQVRMTTEPGLIIISEPGQVNPSDCYTSAFMIYNGQRVHSTLSNLSVTTDSSGYAEMILVVLTDQWHHYVTIDGDWTCTNIST